MTTRSSVDQFLSQKRVALVGVSRTGRKFGNTIRRELARKGYEVLLVHPEAAEIDGQKCYPSLGLLPRAAGGVVVVVPPAQAEGVVRQAAAAGIRNVWMQQGSASPQAIEFCRSNGINEVHGECILMFTEPSGLHLVHRWIWGLAGKLPATEA